MIVAFAGRRIDAPDARVARFPLSSADRVRQHVEGFLRDAIPNAVVGSAACGADLIVLDIAGALAIRRRVVLPIGKDVFRSTSVTDRPGRWGSLFDRVIAEVESSGDLVTLPRAGSNRDAFAGANAEVFRQAELLTVSDPSENVALAIWDGRSRGSGDMTAAFVAEATRCGWRVASIDTSEP
jgi:hypothetical protein